MQCIECKSPRTRVIDSRRVKKGKVIRRRRQCEKCFCRFTTYELDERFLARKGVRIL